QHPRVRPDPVRYRSGAASRPRKIFRSQLPALGKTQETVQTVITRRPPLVTPARHREQLAGGIMPERDRRSAT
ncbi:MAG TPA: hypothetical protein VFA65_12280, partial [Bryobacteraceae bacterium]|nr:hypothetical protein [Bryobacteraceae bacterium]